METGRSAAQEKIVMLTALTLFHVAISLIGIASGFVVVRDLLRGRVFERWTDVFLATTAGTTVTGFFFPFERFLPAHGVGLISLPPLAIAFAARYRHPFSDRWRGRYAVSAVMAQYLNVLVLVVQLFRRVPALHALAPTESEAPLMITQLAVLAAFVVLGVMAWKGSRKMAAPAAARAAGMA